MKSYDCIVIGVGAMGSAACLSLARRGLCVLGIDQFTPPHDRGSSHGETRIIRRAYFEHPDYVPLLHRAYERWDALAAEAGAKLIERVGLLLMGLPDGEVISGVKRAAAEHKLAIDELSAADASARFPAFRVPHEMTTLFEPDAGFLWPEMCIESMIRLARSAGADMAWGTPVRDWQREGRNFQVRTDREEYVAPRLVFAAGAWTSRLLAMLKIPLTPLRKVQLWFRGTSRHRADARCPVFCADTAEGFFYGAPSVADDLVKVALHSGHDPMTNPDKLDRALRASDAPPVAAFIRQVLPEVGTTPLRHAACMYTMTPDGHFIVDRHPENPAIAIAAGFSGHGFKFAPVIGEALADLAIEGRARSEFSFLSLGRAGLRA